MRVVAVPLKIAPVVPKPLQQPMIVKRHGNHIFGRLASLRDCKTIQEAATKCGMDFVAHKRPLLIPQNPTFSMESFVRNRNAYDFEYNPDCVAIHHQDGTYLSTTGKGYGIIQYPEIFEFTEVFINNGEATYEHGAISGGGKNAYLVMKTNDFIEICPGDKIECYFYFTSSHDGTRGLSLIPAPLRTSNNTVFFHEKIAAIKFRHSKHVMQRLHRAKESIERVKQYFKDFDKSFRLLATRKLTEDYKDKYLRFIFPDSAENPKRAENVRDKIKDLMNIEPSLQLPPTKDTLLGAYFAVVQYVDHYMTVKKSKKNDEISARIEASIGADGAGARRKAEALAMALQFKENT